MGTQFNYMGNVLVVVIIGWVTGVVQADKNISLFIGTSNHLTIYFMQVDHVLLRMVSDQLGVQVNHSG